MLKLNYSEKQLIQMESFLCYTNEKSELVAKHPNRYLKCLYYVVGNFSFKLGIVNVQTSKLSVGSLDLYHQRYHYLEKKIRFFDSVLSELKTAIQKEDPSWTA